MKMEEEEWILPTPPFYQMVFPILPRKVCNSTVPTIVCLLFTPHMCDYTSMWVKPIPHSFFFFLLHFAALNVWKECAGFSAPADAAGKNTFVK